MLTPVTVRRAERLSPSFVRVTLAHPRLRDFGVAGPLYDQRIKVLFPVAGGFPPLGEESWWRELAALPEDRRCPVRTYTVAGVVGSGVETAIQVDFVLHPGAHGPGSDWAAAAAPGDELVVVVPRRGEAFGGIEFDPGSATDLLVVGDETALPAIAQILRELPRDARGAAFVEVPVHGDVRPDLLAPPGVDVTWLVRDHHPVGAQVVAAVRAHLAGGPAGHPGSVRYPDLVVDPDLWETPTYSSSGEALSDPTAPTEPSTYAWIAGESGLVTALRRHLVADLHTPRERVAFMGYWRRGVAMRG